MAGSSERESVGRLVTLQPGHFHSRYSEAVDPMMRDFWRRTSDRESRQGETNDEGHEFRAVLFVSTLRLRALRLACEKVSKGIMLSGE